jgi:hypothetical protein
MSLEKFDSDALADEGLAMPNRDEAGMAVDASIAIISLCSLVGAVLGSLSLGLVIGLGATAGIAAHHLLRLRP